MSHKKTESLARAVEAAAAMFSEKAFEQVQVAEIAARARCSSATIYEVFETKKGLFRAVQMLRLERQWPHFTNGPGEATLVGLMDYLSSRVAGLSKPAMHNFLRSASVDAENSRGNIAYLIERESHLGALIGEVQKCVDAGLLRRGDPSAIAYVMLAGSGYEPVMYGLMFGSDATCDTAAILKMVLGPLVTKRGKAQLKAYIDKSRITGADEATKPSLQAYMKHAAAV